jgi:hypothetical protein
VYDEVAAQVPSAVATLPTTVADVAEAALAQADPEQFARLVETLFGAGATWPLPVERWIAGADSEVVDSKTSAAGTAGRVIDQTRGALSRRESQPRPKVG